MISVVDHALPVHPIAARGTVVVIVVVEICATAEAIWCEVIGIAVETTTKTPVRRTVVLFLRQERPANGGPTPFDGL